MDVRPIVYVKLATDSKIKPLTLKCLLDSGASGSMIAAKHKSKLKCVSTSRPATTWSTPGGDLTTTKTCKCTFVMPEFYRDRVIEWNVSLAPTNLGRMI